MYCLGTGSPVCTSPGPTIPASVAMPGYGPSGRSDNPSISADGRFVAFESAASDIVFGDSNGLSDIFVWDQMTGITTRVSLSSDGVQGNRDSKNASISDQGRYVAFVSAASNLVSGDSNGLGDIFVRDRILQSTIRVSVSSHGFEGNGSSTYPSISANGRRVAFSSTASNLVFGDANGASDIFVHDLSDGTTRRVTVSSAGIEANGSSANPSISDDGRYVAFESTANNLVSSDTNARSDIFVAEIETGAIRRANVGPNGVQANHLSQYPSVSYDGRYVAFWSMASNLVSGDSSFTNDVFVRDLSNLTTVRVPVGDQLLQGRTSIGPSLSDDGRTVVFSASSSSLVSGDTNMREDIFLTDLESGQVTRLSVDSAANQASGTSLSPSISGSGRKVAYSSSASNLVPGDFNSHVDVFLRDLTSSETVRVNREAFNIPANSESRSASVSEDGRYVAFSSQANNLVQGDTNNTSDVFVRDFHTGTTIRASVSSFGGQANGFYPSISASGRYVSFMSTSNNLVEGDPVNLGNIFVRDLANGTTTLVSINSQSERGNGQSYRSSISSDGRYVVFESDSNNLVENDENDRTDIFLRDLVEQTTVMISVDSQNVQSNGDSFDPRIAANGRFVAFRSSGSNLVDLDTNGFSDIFLRDIDLGLTTRISISSSGGEADNFSDNPSISADGRYVSFDSVATNLVEGDGNGYRDVFVYDRFASRVQVASVSSNGLQGDGDSLNPSISGDGKRVAFTSLARNIVLGDINNFSDVFVRDVVEEITTLASIGYGGLQGNKGSGLPGYTQDGRSISGNGRFVAFESEATNLVGGDLNGKTDVFRHELHPAPALLIARLLFLDRDRGTPEIASYILRTPTGTVISSGSIGVALDGRIKVPKPGLGDFELLVKAQGFLQEKTAFTQVSGTVDLGTIALLNGDVDGDNSVTIFDYIELSLAFEASSGDPNWDPNADLDGDGTVTIFDYIILSQNFDRTGDE